MTSSVSADPVLSCPHCPRTFQRKSSRTLHIRKSHVSTKSTEHCPQNSGSQEQVKCNNCQQTLPSITELYKHSKNCPSKSSPKDQCPSPTEFAIKKENIAKLEELANAALEVDDGFVCYKCPKTYKTKAQLKLHLSVHTGLYCFMCPLCPRGYNARTRLKAHMNEHNQIYPYSCVTCQQKFTSEVRLKQHTRRMQGKPAHSKGKTFHCNLCGQGYLHKGNLMRHEKAQHGHRLELPCINSDLSSKVSDSKHLSVSCSETGKLDKNIKKEKVSHGHGSEFSDPANLNSRTSDDKSPLLHELSSLSSGQSTISPRGSTSTSTPDSSTNSKISPILPQVKLHKIHPYACSKCNAVFQTKTELTKHVSRKHPTPKKISGNKTKKTVKQWESEEETRSRKGRKKSHGKRKKRHSRMEDVGDDIECMVCLKRFHKRKKLKKHMRSHKDYFHFCSHCPKVFESRHHLAKHVSYRHPMWQQPWCDMCRKSFTSEYSYKQHMKWHVSSSYVYG